MLLEGTKGREELSSLQKAVSCDLSPTFGSWRGGGVLVLMGGGAEPLGQISQPELSHAFLQLSLEQRAKKQSVL